jgi:hypothetical protein
MKAVMAFRRGNLLRGDCDCTGVNVVVILMSSSVSILAAKVLFCLFFMICEGFQELQMFTSTVAQKEGERYPRRFTLDTVLDKGLDLDRPLAFFIGGQSGMAMVTGKQDHDIHLVFSMKL